MKELSLNVLDVAENSVRANATLVEIEVLENTPRDLMTIRMADDGKGMDEEFLAQVTDPFTTTRTTRKVGMGIPLFKEAAEATGGTFQIKSQGGKGTEVYATFTYSHIDRMPLGDMAGTVSTLVQCNPDIDFLYRHTFNDKSFTFDTREIRETLDGVPLSEPDVVFWVKGFLEENINQLYGGI